MFEELRYASEQLQAALERYLRICSSTQDTFLLSTTMATLPDHTHSYAQILENEAKLVDSYDDTLQRAKRAIKVTRNHASSISPISRLPSEILIRVFLMARDAEMDCVDRLVLVCSRWRIVALDSSSLWSHINLRPYHSKWAYPKLLALPRLHASRSSGTPLDVHLSVISESNEENNLDDGMKDLCASVAPRMRSLRLDFKQFMMKWSDSNTSSAISALFSSAVPGKLTKLVTAGYNVFAFFSTSENINSFRMPMGPDSWEMIVGRKRSDLEAILAPITVLDLSGVFPAWNSQAYHGLVDLRLHADYSLGGLITAEELILILKSSPGLRVLHFGIAVVRQTGDLVARVNLPELEVLHVGSKQVLDATRSSIGIISLFTPGSHPLHLSIQKSNPTRFSKPPKGEFEAFLARSTVAQFRVNDALQPFELVNSVSRLEVLVLSECRDLDFPTPSDSPLSTMYPHVRVCILLNGMFSLNKLRSAVQRYQIEILEIYRVKFYGDGSTVELDNEVVEKELSDVCPNVKVTNIYPLLTKYLDLRVSTDIISS